jgi:predicted N-acetyltransferase YhbS
VFVDENYHRKGVATELFGRVISELRQHGVEKILLNASPYAVPFYHAIGFTNTDTERIWHGIRYTPMEMYL